MIFTLPLMMTAADDAVNVLKPGDTLSDEHQKWSGEVNYRCVCFPPGSMPREYVWRNTSGAHDIVSLAWLRSLPPAPKK